ncbi:MAG TPA: HAD hydrolase-like protein [Patescibacteria group bacterium]
MIRSVIFDWKNTLYDPESKQLLPGAIELLNLLKKEEISLMLISKGSSEMMGEAQGLGITEFFTKIIFLATPKTIESFKEFITPDPKETWFVGDRLDSEIHIGKQLHATTVWVKQGPFANQKPINNEMPEFIISNLEEAYTLFYEQLALSFTNKL